MFLFESGLFEIMFFVVFVFVTGMVIAVFARNITTWNRNNHSPRLTVPARVVSRRAEITHHQHSHSTWYYATFEVDSGDRMELNMTGQEYGMLAEGDQGMLTFQGTRFLGFERC